MADERELRTAMEEKIASLEKQLAYQKAQTKRTEKKTVREEDVRKLARALIERNDSDISPDLIYAELQSLGDYIVNGGNDGLLDWNTLQSMAKPIAEKIADGAWDIANREESQVLKDIKAYLKDETLYISEQDSRDIQNYNRFRKKNLGRFTVSRNGGLPVDVAYAELSEVFGEGIFPSSITHPADALMRIAEVFDNMEPVYESKYAGFEEEAVSYIAADIVNGMLDETVRQTPPTFADRADARLSAEKAKRKQALADLREKQNAKIEKLIRTGRERTETVLREQKEKYEQKAEALREKYKLSKEKASVKRAEAGMRKKIERHAKDLTTKLLKPTDAKHIPEALKSSVAETAEAIAAAHGVSAEDGATAWRLSQVLGKKILFIDGGEDFHGCAVGGIIYIGASSDRTVLQTVAHEYTHLLESKALYGKLRDFVITTLRKEGKSLEGLRTAKRAEHSIYADLSDTDIDFEIVAEFVETRLLTDEDAMRAIARCEGNAYARQLLGMLRELIEKVKNALHIGSAEAEQLRMLERGRDILVEVVRSEETVSVADGKIVFSSIEPLSEQIRQAIAGEMPPRRSVYFGKTPNLLVKLGLKQKPLLASPAHMRENALPKNSNRPSQHGITQTQFEEIPKQLAHPVMVMDSLTRNDSIVVVTDMLDADGLPIIVAINTAGNGFYQVEREHIPANFISSVHGRENFSNGTSNNYIETNAEHDAFLFIDKEKSQNLFRVLGVQFPVRLNDFGFDKIIRQSRNIVNTQFMQKSENDADIRFSVGEKQQTDEKTTADADAKVTDTDKRFAPVESAIRLLKSGADMQKALHDCRVSPREIALRMTVSGESDAEIRRLTGLYRGENGVWIYDNAWMDTHIPDLAENRALRAGYKYGAIDEQLLGLAPEDAKASRRRLLDTSEADTAHTKQATDALRRALRPTEQEFAETRSRAAAKEAARLIINEKVPSVDAAIRTGALLTDIADVLEKKKYTPKAIAELTGQMRDEDGKWATDDAAMIKIIRASGKQLNVQDFTDFLFENAKELSESSYNSQYGMRKTYALNGLGVKIQNPIVNIESYGEKPSELIANEREQEALWHYMEQSYTHIAKPTSSEHADARDVAAGIRTLAQMSPNSRREVVLDLIYANLARRGLKDNGIETFYIVQKQRYAEELAQRIFKEAIAPGAKPGPQWKLTANTALRNNRIVFGEEIGRYLNETIFEPAVNNEAERYRFMQREIDKIKKLNLTKTESAAVQMLAEDTEESRLAFYELLKGKGKNLDVEKCRAAVTVFRECYNLYYDAINEFLVMHGYKPIGFQKITCRICTRRRTSPNCGNV